MLSAPRGLALLSICPFSYPLGSYLMTDGNLDDPEPEGPRPSHHTVLYLLMKLLYLASLVTLVSCSGHLSIRLKSEYQQDLTLTLSQGANPTYIALPIRLPGQVEQDFGKFPIDFEEHYTLNIQGGKIEKLGINSSTYLGDFKPLRGTISPKELHLPLSGLQLVVECEENWSGDKCDVRCEKKNTSSKCAIELVEQDMILSTDYTIDLEKLPTIIGRLKETTKVDNRLRNVVEEKTVEESGEQGEKVVIQLKNEKKTVEKTSKTVEWTSGKDKKKSDIVAALTDLINSLVPSIPQKEGSRPPFLTIKMVEKKEDLKDENDMKTDGMVDIVKAFGLDRITDAFRNRKAEVVPAENDKRDRLTDIMSMMKSMPKKPSRDSGESGELRRMPMGLPMLPGMGFPGLPMDPMSALMGMLPRVARHTTEGSGEAQDDFVIDQIIKN